MSAYSGRIPLACSTVTRKVKALPSFRWLPISSENPSMTILPSSKVPDFKSKEGQMNTHMVQIWHRPPFKEERRAFFPFLVNDSNDSLDGGQCFAPFENVPSHSKLSTYPSHSFDWFLLEECWPQNSDPVLPQSSVPPWTAQNESLQLKKSHSETKAGAGRRSSSTTARSPQPPNLCLFARQVTVTGKLCGVRGAWEKAIRWNRSSFTSVIVRHVLCPTEQTRGYLSLVVLGRRTVFQCTSSLQTCLLLFPSMSFSLPGRLLTWLKYSLSKDILAVPDWRIPEP